MANKDLFVRAAAALSAGDIDHVAEWFTEDFTLHDPAAPGWPGGHDGARRMLESLLSTIPNAKVEVLDMVEEGDRVAVRWRFSGSTADGPVQMSVAAIYRFAGGRIAEDWGIASRSAWP